MIAPKKKTLKFYFNITKKNAKTTIEMHFEKWEKRPKSFDPSK